MFVLYGTLCGNGAGCSVSIYNYEDVDTQKPLESFEVRKDMIT
jgi:hypothetical protein